MSEKIKINKQATIEKGKKGFFGLVYGRTAVVVLLLVLQVIILMAGFFWLGEYMYYIYGGVTALAVLLVLFIINKRENPAFKLVWIILILLVPVFGAMLYLFVELQIGTKWMNARIQKLHQQMRRYTVQDQVVAQNLERENQQVAHLANYINRFGGYPAYQNTSAKFFPIGEDKFKEMVIQLEKAEKFIFLEYFIIHEGYMLNTVVDILKKKVKQGVEVRFMYDGMCSLALMPYRYPEELEKYGIQCRMFSPVKPALSTHQNNRDHRKVLVIDGRVAFTGGVNLADEYINQKVRFGHWKDTAIMIEGDAVRSFTLMFLEMWNLDKYKVIEDYDKYLSVNFQKTPDAGDGFVIPYGDNPLDREPVGELVYMDILNTANRYVHIMTPYLVLDNEMMTALTYAAKRGVEIIIIMPHIPDKWYAFVLAKTYYNELLDAGVHIYEYTPGFVHAKGFISDDVKAVVGTINLDFRSLYLHFEDAVYMYKNSAVADVERDFQETLKKCQKITQEDYKKQKLFNKLAGRVLRLLAPLM
ncbi:cardiolipin synthase [Murimonas intestini]|uniref:Cardiolipin synthase n=1 Tax=Murimonas intestini TaxID=1337051 RepID=A0AB73T7B3_9FIRM|nr:cardiolipin synthase [Murimonas intestini]MCR1841326.1 cardiolipin synthase [Murimonas intestini]MCR1866244.1 cardiolipin synthase [Murimonas intestini]MCR1882639.1 cardiolipin synthase [Murimonas intestini]